MALRRRAVPYALGLPLGACLYGAASDLFDWPDPLPLFVDTARASVRIHSTTQCHLARALIPRLPACTDASDRGPRLADHSFAAVERQCWPRARRRLRAPLRSARPRHAARQSISRARHAGFRGIGWRWCRAWSRCSAGAWAVR